jgi:hypothetical protein
LYPSLRHGALRTSLVLRIRQRPELRAGPMVKVRVTVHFVEAHICQSRATVSVRHEQTEDLAPPNRASRTRFKAVDRFCSFKFNVIVSTFPQRDVLPEHFAGDRVLEQSHNQPVIF